MKDRYRFGRVFATGGFGRCAQLGFQNGRRWNFDRTGGVGQRRRGRDRMDRRHVPRGHAFEVELDGTAHLLPERTHILTERSSESIHNHYCQFGHKVEVKTINFDCTFKTLVSI